MSDLKERNKLACQKYRTTTKGAKSQRRNWLKFKYGITPEYYEEMLNKQKGLCLICNSIMSEKNICIDHDHQTGKIRELLCRSCNVALGHFREDEEILKSAINYLKHHK